METLSFIDELLARLGLQPADVIPNINADFRAAGSRRRIRALHQLSPEEAHGLIRQCKVALGEQPKGA